MSCSTVLHNQIASFCYENKLLKFALIEISFDILSIDLLSIPCTDNHTWKVAQASTSLKGHRKVNLGRAGGFRVLMILELRFPVWKSPRQNWSVPLSYCPCDLCDTNHCVIHPLRSRKLLDPVTRCLFVYMGVLCDFGPDKCGCWSLEDTLSLSLSSAVRLNFNVTGFYIYMPSVSDLLSVSTC